MSSPPDSHKPSFFTQALDAWVLAAQEPRAQRHLQAAGPCHRDERQAAVAQIAQLLLVAFEELCLVSEALREDSQAIRRHAEEVCARSQHLLARPRSCGEPSARLAAPSPEEV